MDFNKTSNLRNNICKEILGLTINYRYHLDPSGTFLQYDAKAIGSGSEGAQQSLQEVFHKVISSIFKFYYDCFNSKVICNLDIY